jgi:hypothetical protein
MNEGDENGVGVGDVDIGRGDQGKMKMNWFCKDRERM